MRDVASGLGLVVVAVAYFLSARGLPPGQGEPGPRVFPFLLAAALLGFAITIVVRGAPARSSFEGDGRRTAAVIALTATYAVTFSLLGFLLSTLAYCAGVVLIIGERGWRALIIPVVTTGFLYFAFVVGLGVALP